MKQTLFSLPLPNRSGTNETVRANRQGGEPLTRRRSFRLFSSTFLFTLLTLLSVGTSLKAQTSAQIGTGTEVSSTTLYSPFYRFSSTSTTSGSRANMVFTAAEMAAAGILPGSIITAVQFNKANAATFNGTVPFQMLVANTANTTLATSLTWADIQSTHTEVINNPAYSLPAAAGWVTFTFATPFNYTGGAFEVATSYSITGLTSPHSTDKIQWEYTSGFADKLVGTPSATGTTLSGTTTAYKQRPNIKIVYTPATACSGTPTPGNATATETAVCNGASFEVTLTGTTAATGLTYQWQSSPNNTAWTDITGATSSKLTTTQTGATYYRAKVMCGSNTANSGSILIGSLGTGLNGTFTINKNAAPSASNFTSFASALSALSCGVSGPVTFNVVAGSGPYNEQVSIPALLGTSATNKVIFEGNNNKITWDGSTERSVIKLDGADFVTIRNFQIEASDVTIGWGIHFINGADNNTISGNTITIASTSTTEANSVGIVFSNSLTTVITAGNNGNNNIVSNNTITGGYKGIHLNGTVAGVGNNQLINNTIKDFYSYGIEVSAANATLVEGNDISRPTRATVTTFYGIYLSSGSIATQVSKNRIHNANDGDTTPTGATYGVYITACDAPTGSENIVKNNLFYNLNSTGTVYALYNSSSDGAHYFHNTISLDHALNTGTVRGFYQITTASNIRFNNNIITISGGGTTAKYGLYFGTAASTIISDNNVIYLAPTAGNAFTGYYGAAFATLANWQTANSGAYDQNSVAANPVYEDPASGNFKPTSFFVNNIGQPIANVTDDITGATRSTTAPDAGAYEFTIPAKDLSVSAIITPIGGCGITNQETVTITVTNMGTDPQTNIPVQFSTNGGTTWSTAEVIPGPLVPGASITYTFVAKANLSTPGAYNFQARTQLTGDGKTSNDTFTTIIDALPTIATFPYQEDFEGTAYTGWVASGTNSSWELGTPNKTAIIGAASGANAWVTKLTAPHNDNEQSQVVSPCFNLSSLQKPIIEMSIWWEAEASFDGAVLQYTTNNGQSWTNVGAFGEPNWYNDNNIDAGPGGQTTGTTSTAEGWTGSSTTSTPPSSNGWVTVKHNLPTALVGQTNVRFRLAWATDANTVDDGFAFDNVKVYDTPANDVGVQGINQLASGCGLSTVQDLTITVRNFGTQAQDTIPVTYQVTKPDGSVMALVNDTIYSQLNIGAATSFTFTTKVNLSAPGIYSITACTDNNDGDDQNDCKTITVRSIPTIATFPYSQDFENGDGGWVASGTNSSWAIGTPNKTLMKGAASGTKAYVTSLTGTYNASENSMVVGPCFNFSSFTNTPIIDMKVWWNTEFSVDGAVLQSSTDNGATWNNVGFFGDPNNWFNDASINANPGNQVTASAAEGWSGTGTTGSGAWVRARHALDGLAGQANVKLRIAFASNATTQNEGFAFDDIRVYEQQNIDGAVTFVYPFNSNVCGVSTQEEVKVTIENFGLQALTNVPVSFQVTPANGTPFAEVTETTTGTIAPGASLTYTFAAKANLSNAGVNTVVAKTKISGDQVPQNDASTQLQETIPTVSTFPYSQNFENGDGGWKAGGSFSSWAMGKPAKTVIKNAASGNNAWVTNLTSTYNVNEKSRVLSPCFNFTNIAEPVFQMKAWWHAQASYDGAVLQSSIDNGATWQNVGIKGSPNSLNWFNDATINAGPGDQSAASAQGWTGTTATSVPPTSGGWVIVRHALDGLGGQANVKLRIAFASDASTQNDGFAFDDILIEDVANNISVTAFKPLVNVCGFGTNEPVEVTLNNLSKTTIASGITLQYTVSLNGNVIYTSPVEPYNPAIAANSSAQFIFPTGANLSQAGNYTINVTATRAGDPDLTNNTVTYTVANSLFTTLPQGFSFEPGQKGLADLRALKGTQAAITESAAASSTVKAGSTKGIIMDATSSTNWVLPILTVDPWTNNLPNKSGIYMCLPAQPSLDSLWLIFDLKQTFKDANANTNFRVTVNGNMVGTTMRPPASGTPDVWKTVKIDLTSFKNQPLQIGLESSTKEGYQNGAGTANLVDNIIVRGRFITGSKDDILQGQLSVFPNPSNGQFNVSLPQGKTYELEVADLTGRMLKKQTVKGGSSQLDLQGASQGIYLLKVKSENATAIRKLVIE